MRARRSGRLVFSPPWDGRWACGLDRKSEPVFVRSYVSSVRSYLHGCMRARAMWHAHMSIDRQKMDAQACSGPETRPHYAQNFRMFTHSCAHVQACLSTDLIACRYTCGYTSVGITEGWCVVGPGGLRPVHGVGSADGGCEAVKLCPLCNSWCKPDA